MTSALTSQPAPIADLLHEKKVSSLPRDSKLNSGLGGIKPAAAGTLPVPSGKRGTGGRSSMPNIASALHQYMLSKPIELETDKPSDSLQNNDNPDNVKDNKSKNDKNTEKETSLGETDNTIPSETADEGSNVLRMFSKVAALPSLLAERVKTSQSKQIENGELIDLTFLNEEEITVIQKVVQADLRLRRNILG